MKTLAAAIAATMLLIAPISAPSQALAGVPAGNLRAAVPQTENASIQEVRNQRRGVRYERRKRNERRVRYERRPQRHCYSYGHCSVVYITVPIYYYVPIWYSHPIYYYW
jgi:hypothetical protein